MADNDSTSDYIFPAAEGIEPHAWQVYKGDCRETMKYFANNGVLFDAIVTDPPYHLTSIVNRFGKEGAAPAQFGTDGAFARASRGFMGKEWDGGDVAFQADTWRAAYDVLKPGAHMLVFGGTRTYHRLVCAIEEAGFEIRDAIMWHYGTGFPKSHSVSKGIDKTAATDATKQWEGWGTALKPATEIICLARKPLGEKTVVANVLKHGTGALNIDASRVPLGESDSSLIAGVKHEDRNLDTADNEGKWGFKAVDREAGLPRWPANLIHDGSDEVLELFPNTNGQCGKDLTEGDKASSVALGDKAPVSYTPEPRGDKGSAARFFYCAKAGKNDRAGSKHPTVKPLALIRYLIRMITPPGGTVLDPFAGSGTTGASALMEGHSVTLCEMDDDYTVDIENRMNQVKGWV